MGIVLRGLMLALGDSLSRRGCQAASLDEYAGVIRDTLGHLDVQIDLEPGRMIAGNAGILLSRVIWVKRGRA